MALGYKLAEFSEFKSDSTTQSFTMSPSRWVLGTNAIGFVSRRGKYGEGVRLIKLNETAQKQLNVLSSNDNVRGIENLDVKL